MAYHLAHEAREGLLQFRIPRDFGKRLFEFQALPAVGIGGKRLITAILENEPVDLWKRLCIHYPDTTR